MVGADLPGRVVDVRLKQQRSYGRWPSSKVGDVNSERGWLVNESLVSSMDGKEAVGDGQQLVSWANFF
jgi:hypothetical protein